MDFSKKCLKKAVCPLLLLALVAPLNGAHASSNLAFRAMAANLNGNSQTIEQYAIRIFQGLKPDVVAIQEFNRLNNTDADLRSFVNEAFGTNFYYYRESGYQIPNGIISRYPIISAGSWPDPEVSNRGFAWARLDLPGTNDLYVVSVHLLTSSASDRSRQATNLKNLILGNSPTNAWIILAGDMNTDTRSEAAITTFKTFLSDSPIPTDAVSGGKPGTNLNRDKPYDYVLPSFSLAAWHTNTVMPSLSFPNGLVFDSRVYQPISDVSPPVQSSDSGNGQHMAVIRTFSIPVYEGVITGEPVIASHPTNKSVLIGQDATFSASATGQQPLWPQWFFAGTLIPGATGFVYTRTNVQAAHLGAYHVVVTNTVGAVTSAPAQLTLYIVPTINQEPSSLTLETGQTASFTVSVAGSDPMSYQWFFAGSAMADGNASTYTRSPVMLEHAGTYQAVVSNIAGSVTSKVANLTVLTPQPVERSVITRWAFNNTNAPLSGPPPDLGAGMASLVGGATATYASGTLTDTNGTNQAWNTTGYPSVSSGNKSAGAQFRVSTAGRKNIEVRWDSRASSTGSKYVRLLYSTNGGSSFLETPKAWTNSTSFESRTNRLGGLPGVEDNTNFAFRIVTEFENSATGQGAAGYVGATGTYAGTGTLRLDMVTVSGEAISLMPVAPWISHARTSANSFVFDVSGETGAAYVVESSAALASEGWQPVMTNTAPFTFTQTNRTSQSFFRARSR